MDWFLPLVVGLVVGALGRLLMPGMHPAGFLITMVVGVVGAYFGALIGMWFGWYSAPGDSYGLGAAILGASLLIVSARLFLWPPRPK